MFLQQLSNLSAKAELLRRGPGESKDLPSQTLRKKALPTFLQTLIAPFRSGLSETMPEPSNPKP